MHLNIFIFNFEKRTRWQVFFLGYLFSRLLKSVAFIFFLVHLSVVAKAQTADFNFTPESGNFCGPSNVLFNANFSEEPFGFNWKFGVNAAESLDQNPTYTYTQPGTYRVTLSVLFPAKLVVVEKDIIIFGSPNITINPSRNFICQPENVDFIATGNVPLKTLNWDFDDGTLSTVTDDTTFTHQFTIFKRHTVRLNATDINGCIGAVSTVVNLRKPPINSINATPMSGCVPANVRLRATVNVPNGTTVTSYIWSFGDGSPDETTTVNTVNHIYTNTTGVKPSLSIITSEGCTNEADFDSLFFGTPPQNLVLSVPKNTYCFSETPVFRAKADNANQYRWNFGDGTTVTTSDTTISHEYKSRNTFTVRVTPLFNGCAGTSATTNINIVGPIADYSFSNSCTDKSTFDFTNTSVGIVDSISWRFGSGGPFSMLPNPKYTFPATGGYSVRLYVYQNSTGCSDIISRNVFSTAPLLVPTDSAVCIRSLVSLRVNTPYNNPAARYTFSIAGKDFPASGSSSRTTTADSIGLFTNRVIVNDGAEYCNDTLIQNFPILVSGPLISYSMPETICLLDSFWVQNNSRPGFPQDTLVSWQWDFGDGIRFDSVPNPQPFLYTNPGNYRVLFRLTDIIGCTDTASKQVNVRTLPLLAVSPSTALVCPNEIVNLNALNQGAISWLPTGSTSCDTCSTVTVQTTVPRTYTAIAIDTFGCSSQFDVTVNIQPRYTFQDNLRDTLVCAGQPVPLNVGDSGLIYRWTPAIGLSSPIIPNPVASPSVTTTYQLNVVDSAGCYSDSADVVLTIAPQPTVDAGPDLLLPYNAPFALNPTYSPDVSIYQWLPASQLNCSSCANPTGRALETRLIVVNASNADGCKSSDSLLITIECDPANLLMPTAFSPNGDNLNDFFYPLTRGVTLIKRFQIFSRYGQMIYERYNITPNDRSFGWDGTINGKPQGSGNYIYIIDAQCDQGNIISTKGSVMLLR